MSKIRLVKHSMNYCEQIYKLSSAPPVRDALGLPKGTVENTKQFVNSVIQEEKEGKTVSRVILNEVGEVIGITTLMFIDDKQKSCHIGSWIGP